MSSTKDYVPLDSDAASAFSSVLTTNYVRLTFVMLVLYDHVITLDKEIERIWTLRWRLPKIIFLINRYILTWFIVLWYIPSTIYPLTQSYCKFSTTLLGWSPIFNFCAAELLMIIRVCALYDHGKLIIWSLGGCFVVTLTSAMVTQVLFMHTFYPIVWYEFLPGCAIAFNGPFIQWHAWVPALSIEGVLMLLTAYKVISYGNNINRTVTVLARDSAIYFVILFAGIVLTVADAIHNFVPVSPLFPTQCITSIAVGRMMMNIRGLILTDPEHTGHLTRTFEFASRHDSGSEEEEGA